MFLVITKKPGESVQNVPCKNTGVSLFILSTFMKYELHMHLVGDLESHASISIEGIVGNVAQKCF